MNPRRFMFIVLLLSCIAVSVAPICAECPGPLTLDYHFGASQAVFVGRAIAQRIVPHPLRLGVNERVTETTFQVEQRWKGPATTTIQVQTCGWSDFGEALTCSEDFKFVVGSRYVVFAAAIRNGALETSLCVPTSSVDRATVTLQWLSSKPRQ